MSDVPRTEIDGVRVFVVDAPGPLVGTLTFRVGQRATSHGLDVDRCQQ